MVISLCYLRKEKSTSNLSIHDYVTEPKVLISAVSLVPDLTWQGKEEEAPYVAASLLVHSAVPTPL